MVDTDLAMLVLCPHLARHTFSKWSWYVCLMIIYFLPSITGDVFLFTGFVQFIESTALADVLQKEGSILNFFRKHAPCEGEALGVQPEVIDNYVKSCGKLFVNASADTEASGRRKR